MVHNFLLFSFAGMPQCAAALRDAAAFAARVVPDAAAA
eukprot:CAMPEP_0113682908 /NCGR_PEP_ID=MMETSP0038_2-20120614/12955_1 /TAXON_ID=2898 /ORGANISM="Cryptomonas paramecium" /LENGTH=37 /DNA_ID=CAMNT_0000602091 /DNA_START=345 /DNA_END=454 /DNA_ORIENTATION=+ /assembly_acc=CAM_ASM_000170